MPDSIIKPRLLVDDRWNRGGIGRYANELLLRMAPHFSVSRVGGPVRLNDPLTPLYLAAAIRRDHADAFWSPGFMPPAFSAPPFVFTIHDLIHIRAAGAMRAAYYNSIIRPMCRRAFRIVTVSEYSRQEICEWAALTEDRVAVISNAVSGEFTPEGPKYTPGYPYILYVGNRKPHKNLPMLLRAFAKSGLQRQYRMLFSGPPDADLQILANQLHLADALRFAGNIPESELPSVYRGAAAVTLLSTYEGFGLPALEGLACGTPVLCSSTTSLPEVVGDAAVTVAPDNVDEIAWSMQRIVGDEALRTMLVRRGLLRAGSYQWDDSGRKLTALLQDAAQRR